ncbi:hypothetical protein O0L34_g1466 [Tuta absoluta]|nr:hypothetical protein O0L34_g1466 [Tuta absoluta]
MTFTRGRNPQHYHYFIGGEPVSRVERVRDLGVWFDPELTLREHTQRVVDAAHRRLGFVLRNATPLSVAATKALLRDRPRSVLARAAGRTTHRRHSPVERARALLGSVLAAAPQCDLFASGIACVMRECQRMYEMHVRETSVPI